MVVKSESVEVARKLNLPYDLLSYILGIVAIVEAVISPIAGIALSVIGLVFANKKQTDISIKAKKLNFIALAIGIVSLIISLLIVYVFGSGLDFVQ